MTREKTADFARRNPDHRVDVAVTFGPLGSSILKGIDQSAIRVRLVKVRVANPQADVVLVSQQY
ncbi:MAG: hypothetical protein U1D66_06875 [Erythrobacter sp.]|nr:hypothetical protein [Erythrobacter sp.]